MEPRTGGGTNLPSESRAAPPGGSARIPSIVDDPQRLSLTVMMAVRPVNGGGMGIQPRVHLLDIWRAVVASSLSSQGEWVWGGRDGSDSVADAHQLLCLMFPATELAGFHLDAPAGTDAEVLTALQGLADSVEIPRRLARICLE